LSFFSLKSQIKDQYGDKKIEDSNEYFAYYVIRPVSFWIATLFVILKVSANSVTWLSLIFGLFGFILFFIGGYAFQVIASIFILIWLILDHVDGNMARYYKSQSSFGDFLDSFVCYIVFALIPIAIAHSIANDDRILHVANLYILGWMFSLGFTLSRLIYQKFKQIENTTYKNVLSGSENNFAFHGLFKIVNNLFNPSGLLVPVLVVCTFFRHLELFLVIYGVGYAFILIYSSAVFIMKARNY
jgi:phosphatidylserine synthase